MWPHPCNPSTVKSGEGGSLWFCGFQPSSGFRERSSLKRNKVERDRAETDVFLWPCAMSTYMYTHVSKYYTHMNVMVTMPTLLYLHMMVHFWKHVSSGSPLCMRPPSSLLVYPICLLEGGGWREIKATIWAEKKTSSLNACYNGKRVDPIVSLCHWYKKAVFTFLMALHVAEMCSL